MQEFSICKKFFLLFCKIADRKQKKKPPPPQKKKKKQPKKNPIKF